MKLDDYRFSDNVNDQRGQNFGGGGGGMGGGALGLIISLVASRFGIVGVGVVLLGAWMLGMFGTGGGSGVVSSGQPRSAAAGGQSAAAACNADEASRFSCRVLASTEDTWARIFATSGQRYQPATFTFYDGRGQSGCGAAQAAMGPFYCPSDNGIYVDTSFYTDLQTKFGAAGDFAQAYVIAHEVGHHIQTLTGVSDQVRALQQRASRAEGNRLQVAMELQADCYAGVWAANNPALLSEGDIEEGIRAAQAIGDDTLQRASGGRVVPESFTHGTSAQRAQWLKTGLQSGNPAACDTFGGRLS